MLRKARVISMIILAASIVVTAGMAVENLVLASIALSIKRERRCACRKPRPCYVTGARFFDNTIFSR